MPRPVRAPAERLLGWLVCGPLGHLWAGVLDWLELAVRLLAGRLGARASRDRGA